MNSELGKRQSNFEVPSSGQLSQDFVFGPCEEIPQTVEGNIPNSNKNPPPDIRAEIDETKSAVEVDDEYDYEKTVKTAHRCDHIHWVRAMKTFPSRSVYMKRVDGFCWFHAAKYPNASLDTTSMMVYFDAENEKLKTKKKIFLKVAYFSPKAASHI